MKIRIQDDERNDFMLKKLSSLFFTTVLVFVLTGTTQAAAPALDQSFDGTPQSEPMLSATFNNGQTFQPTLSRLAYVKVKLKVSTAATVHLQVRKGTAQTLAAAFKSLGVAGYSWVTLDFTDQAVTQGAEYSIWMSGGGIVQWGHGDTGGGSYANGKSYVLGLEDADDFHFKTYGYNPTAPPVNQNTNTNTNTNTNDNSSVEDDKLIPKNLKANEAGDTWVDLSWDEPEEADGVEGYLISWGENCDELNESVDVGKETSYRLEGLDPDKDYCIAVASYDEDYETSESSDKLEIKTNASEEEEEQKDRKGQWWLVAGFSLLALVIAGVVIYLVVRAKKKKKAEEKKKSRKAGSASGGEEGPPEAKGAGPDAPTPTPTDNPQLDKPK